MKGIIVVLFSSLIIFNTSFAFADKALLDALGDEAKATMMDESVTPSGITQEPPVIPSEIVDFDVLEKKIERQIKGVLKETSETINKEGNSDKNIDKDEFQNKLENIVSSAVLKGNKFDDIRSAVSAAMVDIKKGTAEGGEISVSTIESAANALETIVGETTSVVVPKNTPKLQPLKSELGASELVESSSKSKSEQVEQITVNNPTVFIKDAVDTKKVEVESEAFIQTPVVVAQDTVTVLEGENLYKVAQRVFGSGARYLDLYNANKDTIQDPNFIRTGQVLRLP